MTEQRWKGKTVYPRDVATKRHVDRVQDRLDRRIDLHGEKVERLKSTIVELQRESRDLRVIWLAVIDKLSGGSEEE